MIPGDECKRPSQGLLPKVLSGGDKTMRANLPVPQNVFFDPGRTSAAIFRCDEFGKNNQRNLKSWRIGVII